MKRYKSNSIVFVLKALLIMVFLPLVGVFTGSTHGVAYAQDRCQAERNAWEETQRADFASQNAWSSSDEIVQRLFASILRTPHEVSALRERIANIDTLEIFIPDRSPQKDQMEELRKSYEDRLKLLIQQETKSRSDLIPAMEDWTRKDEQMDIAIRRWDDAQIRLIDCERGTTFMNPVPSSSRPAPGVRGITVRLVDSSTNPSDLKPYGGWTWPAGGGNIDYRNPSVGQQTFQWTTPAQEIGPAGFQITLDVQSRSNPNSRSLAGISIRGGDFILTPNPAHVEALSENQQVAHKTMTVTVTPPQNFSGKDLYLVIGADYGPSFIYHYEVIR